MDFEKTLPGQNRTRQAAGESGYIHSWETGSTVDGPGVRMVLWTTGCPMRCQYCHNPDTWKLHNGQKMDESVVMEEVRKYAHFLRLAGGGVTVSGGEPLVQAPFVSRIFRACKRLGLHTALDTNGYLGDRLSDEDLDSIDLVILDIKSWDSATHRKVTHVSIEPVTRFARRLSDLGKPGWVRFVLVPGLTDDRANVEGLADFVATLQNIERVEVLQFHQMGRYKWRELALPYQLEDTRPPDSEMVARTEAIFRARGLPVDRETGEHTAIA